MFAVRYKVSKLCIGPSVVSEKKYSTNEDKKEDHNRNIE
jgi:hypothetical protein